MADELKDQRVVTMMSPTDLEIIDDWMFKNRIRSRGEAIRRLTRMGLAADEKRGELLEHMNGATTAFWVMMDVLAANPEDARSETLTFSKLLHMYKKSVQEMIRANEIILRTIYAGHAYGGQFPLNRTDEAMKLFVEAADSRTDKAKFAQVMEKLKALGGSVPDTPAEE